MLDAWLPSKRNHYSCTRNKWCPGSRRTTSGGWTHGHVLWNKKEVVCIQIMLKTPTWLWSLTRTPHPGPVIPADSLSPLPLIALWYEYRHALLMRCLHHSILLTSDTRPCLHRRHPWSSGGPFLVLGDCEISQSRNNSNNNNNSDNVSI